MEGTFRVIDRGTNSIKWTHNLTCDAIEELKVHSTETLLFKQKFSDAAFIYGEEAYLKALDPSVNQFRSTLAGGIAIHQKKFVPNKTVISQITDALLAQESTKASTLLLPLSTKCNKAYEKKELERHFEVFGVECVGRPRVSSCTLASMGTYDGTVVDAGHQSIELESVVEGYANIENSSLSFRGGHYMTRILMNTIEDRMSVFYADDNMVARQAIDCLKRQHAAFKSHDEKVSVTPPVAAVLPDGYSISLTSEDTSSCCESIFSRSGDMDLSSSENNLAEDLFDHIWRTSLDLRLDQLCNKVVLTGGVALTAGFKGRLETELEALYHQKTKKHQKVTVSIPPEPLNAAVTGAVLLGLTVPLSGDPASSMWLSRKQYLEQGPDRAAFLS